jgi:SRSO17 transposase
MRNRLWVIILLIAWVGQWVIGVPEMLPQPEMSGWAVWSSAEDLAALVVYQARRGMTWPPPRSHGRRRRQRCGKPPFRRPRVTTEGEEQAAQPERTRDVKSNNVFAPQRWGLSPDFSRELPERLHHFGQRYYECFKTKTRNTGEYAYHYLSCLLRMETKRNYINIGRAAGVAGENIQHFMSNSPWSARVVMEQVQQEIKTTPDLKRGGVVILDESADEKAGDKSAGAGRQYNGRLGKVDMSQVGTLLAYANLTDPDRPIWTWVDGELYLQEHWFAPEMAELRQRVGIPPEREFETKIELGWKMIQRVKANGLPFEAVACDDLYGRSTWLRDKMDGEEIIYMADVPCTTQIYLEKPVLGVPECPPGRRGPKPTRLQVLNGVKPFKAHQVARRADTIWTHVRVRTIERGELDDPFAARRVWTLREGELEPVEEWLVIRREAKNRYNYSLSNAPADASLEYLAWLKCQRYFVERTNQDAKSEAGWDELEARKYRGWEHHLALVILAVWFAAQTKWEWAKEYTRDPTLAQQFAVEVLPTLSMANIRVLLRAAMPLPQPTPEEAVALVAEHFVNRTRSRKSQLRRQKVVPTANAPP